MFELRKLYNRVGWQFSDQVVKKIQKYVNATEGSSGYYKIKRGEDFDPNSWRKKLAEKHIDYVNSVCDQYMKMAFYT